MIETPADLRSRYSPAGQRALQKQLTRLEQHSIRFIELSPFLVIASANKVFRTHRRGAVSPGS